MVSKKSVEAQLKRIHFNYLAWGKTEIQELPNIILPEEHILECVNGMYEGGFALLVATDMRVLLIDKKPLNYLTVEDLRFDMISEIDYSHRLFGARININTSSKSLRFTSYNQPRLRKLIEYVQHHMADLKKVQNGHQEDQKQHLEQINQQLQAYLIAQHQQQAQLMQQLQKQPQAAAVVTIPEPIKASPELADFLLAQRLMQDQAPAVVQAKPIEQPERQEVPEAQVIEAKPEPAKLQEPNSQLADLYAEGMQEIFGRRQSEQVEQAAAAVPQPAMATTAQPSHALEVNPMSVAYSKLPMALRNRKFGRPSFHAHSQQSPQPLAPQPNTN